MLTVAPFRLRQTHTTPPQAEPSNQRRIPILPAAVTEPSHLLDEAQRRAATRLLLAVYPQNDRARRFYARHGFAEIGALTFMVGDVPFRDLIYARDL